MQYGDHELPVCVPGFAHKQNRLAPPPSPIMSDDHVDLSLGQYAAFRTSIEARSPMKAKQP